MARRWERTVPLAAGALAAVAGLRLAAALASGNALNHVSGAWIALADDLAHGTLYRPLVGELGTGGTRFFPLGFALHAALLRAGGGPLVTGHLLSVAAGAALLAGLAALHRRLGLAPLAAAAFAALPLAGAGTELGLAAVRGDLLAAALQVLALASLARRPRFPWLPAALLAAAIATKPTAAAGAAAATAWLLLRRERRAAALLAGLAAAGALALLGAAEIASEGRFSAVLAACAGAGVGPGDLARAPLRLAAMLAGEDPGGLVLLAAALLALGAAARARAVPALPALWLAAAAATLLAVLATPGTGVNHLVDLEAAAAAVLAGCAVRGGARLALRAAVAAAAAGIAAVAALGVGDLDGSRLGDARRALAAAGGGSILSEDPLVPLLRGERPLVLDPFMLRVMAEARPALAEPLVASIREGAFAAVVLLQDPFADPDGWYERVHLGPSVASAIRTRYAIAQRDGRYVVLRPRPASPGAAPAARLPPDGGPPERLSRGDRPRRGIKLRRTCATPARSRPRRRPSPPAPS